MTDQSFSTRFSVAKSPAEVFAAINNARGWWSEEIEGSTATLGAIFDYRFKDFHRCRIEVRELVPGSRIAWHVVENHFTFTKDPEEWTGTDLFFDIARKGEETEVTFTHRGLSPEHECYEACADGWNTYIRGSLPALIVTGKGLPNTGEALTGSEAALGGATSFSTRFVVDQSPAEVFAAINNVRGWWTGEITGSADKAGDSFVYRYGDLHRSTQTVTEFVPGERVVWHVSDAELSFVADKTEWTGTDIVFDIAPLGDKTELRFSHEGLVPAVECYDSCSNAWGHFINGSLKGFITGAAQPN
jgi:hypothetical protein